MAVISRETSATLLKIPAEIRNRVYSFLTPSDCTFHLEDGKDLEDRTQCSTITTALYHTHPTINREATAILYARNHFSFDCEREAATFIHTIGAVNAAAITSLVINSAWHPISRIKDTTRCLLPALLKLSSVRSLEIKTTDWPTIGDEDMMDYLMIPHMRERLPLLVKTYIRHETEDEDTFCARLAQVDVPMKEGEGEFEA